LKRKEFIRYLRKNGCSLYRHGKRHDIYINESNGKKAPIPRHSELKNSLCDLIKNQLGIDDSA